MWCWRGGGLVFSIHQIFSPLFTLINIFAYSLELLESHQPLSKFYLTQAYIYISPVVFYILVLTRLPIGWSYLLSNFDS